MKRGFCNAMMGLFYNNGFAFGKDSNHRCMTDFGLYTQMIALGWLGEGVVMCGPQ
jgi:hypothetical protein